jgi:chromosome partitioning protein
VPIIAMSNQKGGVGKTTSTLNIGAALSEAGRRVLLIDLDPQGSLTVAAGVLDVDAVHTSTGQLIVAACQGSQANGPSIEEAIIQTPVGMDLVPANGMLCAAEIALASAPNRESVLASMLEPILPRYDYVLIDCLPSLGLLVINALRAADGVVIPVQADFLAVQGLAQILETISAVRTRLNPGLEIYGVLLTMVDGRQGHAQRVVETVRQSLEGQVRVFRTQVSQHVLLKEAAELGQSILEYDGGCASAAAYRDLAREVAWAAGDAMEPAPPRRQGLFGGAWWNRFRRLDDYEPMSSGRTLGSASEARIG